MVNLSFLEGQHLVIITPNTDSLNSIDSLILPFHHSCHARLKRCMFIKA